MQFYDYFSMQIYNENFDEWVDYNNYKFKHHSPNYTLCILVNPPIHEFKARKYNL